MRGLPILLAALLAASSYAGDAPVDVAKAIAEKLKQRYPATRIDQVLPSPLPGVYEVVMGRNVAFSDAEGRYFIFGHLYDMQSQRDLTAERKESLAKVDWSALPLENSIRFVNGKGERVLAVFSDPDWDEEEDWDDGNDSLDDVLPPMPPHAEAEMRQLLEALRRASPEEVQELRRTAGKDFPPVILDRLIEAARHAPPGPNRRRHPDPASGQQELF